MARRPAPGGRGAEPGRGGGTRGGVPPGEGGGRGLKGTPPLRSPKGIPPATTFNMARNLLKLKSKAKSKVKNW